MLEGRTKEQVRQKRSGMGHVMARQIIRIQGATKYDRTGQKKTNIDQRTRGKGVTK